MSRLPFTISNQSLTFFVKGKPHALTRTSPQFEEAKRLLLQPGTHNVEQLVALVDIKAALIRDSHGAIQWVGNDVVWQGQTLKNVWVDKILDFRANNLPFTAIWNALGSLVRNPTAAAIERLPVFLERSQLGFLEDGRFIAYKAVRGDYMDIHTGKSFRNMIGDTPHMPRDQVNANPDACCSTGLHVGTPDYVKDFGLGAAGRRVMLIAVWPHDVVSVPFSYEGTKMRICAYEVIDELDEQYAGVILGRPLLSRDEQGSYRPQPVPAPVPSWMGQGDYQAPDVEDEAEDEPELSDYERIQSGQVVRWESLGALTFSLVVGNDGNNVTVLDPEGDVVIMSESDFEEVVDPSAVTAAHVVYQDCLVSIEGHGFLRDGDYLVHSFNPDGNDQSDPEDESWLVSADDRNEVQVPVRNRQIVRATKAGNAVFPLPEPVAAEPEPVAPVSPRVENVTALYVEVGDTVKVQGSGILDGDYRTIALDNDSQARVCVDSNGRGNGFWVRNGSILSRRPAPAPVAVEPALLAEVGDLVTTAEGGWPPAGTYPVVAIDDGREYRLTLQTEHDGLQGVLNRYVIEVIARPWMRAEIGGTVTLAEDRSSAVSAGTYEVVDLARGRDIPQVQVRASGGNWWVDASRVTKVEPKA